jgi:hypothetical protein
MHALMPALLGELQIPRDFLTLDFRAEKSTVL